MNQDFTVKKEQYLSKKKFVQEVSPGKKIPAQAVREKKKKSYQLKIPHTPHHFSNGPSLTIPHMRGPYLSRVAPLVTIHARSEGTQL